MELRSRRIVGRLARIGLVLLAIVLVVGWLARRTPPLSEGLRQVRVEPAAPSPAALGPGDIQIVSIDTSVELVLQGNRILAGLAPHKVAEIRAELNKETNRDTGFGGSIAKMVKNTVANNLIEMHITYPVSDIGNIRYERGQIIMEGKNGERIRLFENSKTNGRNLSELFRPEDAERFVAAVRSRMNAPAPAVR
jgi:hypothetical protein